MDYFRLLVVAAAGAAALAPIPPHVIERWYSQRFYARIQPLITGVSSLVPFALLDVAIGILIICAAIGLVRTWRTHRLGAWLRRTAGGTALLIAVLYLWFVVIWGFNYRRVPLEQKLAYEASRISPEQALTLARIAVARANALAAQSRAGSSDADEALASAFADVQRSLGGLRVARVAQPKRSLLTWYFRTAAIDGMTDPFFLEIILTPDLLPFERPQTLAHEWAHLAGYADESEANFVAWLTCVQSTPAAQYSGWLAAYQHLVRVLPHEDRQTLRKTLTPPVVADLQAVAARLSRASPAVSHAARGAYDTYLRANRIEEGIASYGAVVRLMLGTAFEEDWTPRLRE